MILINDIIIMMDYYYSFNKYLSNMHNERIWRIPLSTGYPCPNRIDGKTGCTFCNGISFLPHYLKDNDTLENQINRGIKFFGNRYKVKFFYGYIQDNTGTYGDLDRLLEIYQAVLSKAEMKGLIISTRPDYINLEIIEELNKLQDKYNKDIWIELGLQSTDDTVLKRINRNHTYEDFKKAVKFIKSKSRMKITVHMIIGLPGETPEKIKKNIKALVKENDIDGIKFRLLEIIDGTPIEHDYQKNPSDFYRFDFDSYCVLLCDLLEIIPNNIVIMRLVNFKSLQNLSGNSDKKISKLELLKEIDKIFFQRKTYQGIKFEQI
jgi:radical SAM protein (TIGR01212 family)